MLNKHPLTSPDFPPAKRRKVLDPHKFLRVCEHGTVGELNKFLVPEFDSQVKNDKFQTGLVLAAFRGREQIVDALLGYFYKQGRDVVEWAIMDALTSVTSYSCGINKNYIQDTLRSIKQGVERLHLQHTIVPPLPSQPNHRDQNGRGTIEYFAMVGAYRYIPGSVLKNLRKFAQRGKDELPTFPAETPLYLACVFNPHLGEIFLEKGNGYYELCVAIFKKDLKALEGLKENKIVICSRSLDLQTPLHFACAAELPAEVIQDLCRGGGFPFARNKQDKTPDQLTRNGEIKKILRSYYPSFPPESLHHACLHSQLTQVKKRLRTCSLLDEYQGETAFEVAVKYGDKKLRQWAIKVLQEEKNYLEIITNLTVKSIRQDNYYVLTELYYLGAFSFDPHQVHILHRIHVLTSDAELVPLIDFFYLFAKDYFYKEHPTEGSPFYQIAQSKRLHVLNVPVNYSAILQEAIRKDDVETVLYILEGRGDDEETAEAALYAAQVGSVQTLMACLPRVQEDVLLRIFYYVAIYPDVAVREAMVAQVYPLLRNYFPLERIVKKCLILCSEQDDSECVAQQANLILDLLQKLYKEREQVALFNHWPLAITLLQVCTTRPALDSCFVRTISQSSFALLWTTGTIFEDQKFTVQYQLENILRSETILSSPHCLSMLFILLAYGAVLNDPAQLLQTIDPLVHDFMVRVYERQVSDHNLPIQPRDCLLELFEILEALDPRCAQEILAMFKRYSQMPVKFTLWALWELGNRASHRQVAPAGAARHQALLHSNLHRLPPELITAVETESIDTKVAIVENLLAAARIHDSSACHPETGHLLIPPPIVNEDDGAGAEAAPAETGDAMVEAHAVMEESEEPQSFNLEMPQNGSVALWDHPVFIPPGADTRRWDNIGINDDELDPECLYASKRSYQNSEARTFFGSVSRNTDSSLSRAATTQGETPTMEEIQDMEVEPPVISFGVS